MAHSLDGPDGPVTETSQMLEMASSFYKDLFKKETPSAFTLKEVLFACGENF